MCKNDQNDSYLDSLVDSYAASQDSVEKKLETFAQSRQISQRIARARLNEEDFTNKYHRSKKGEDGEEEPLITIVNSDGPEKDTETIEHSLEEPTKLEEATKLIKTGKIQPDFVGASSTATLTKPLSDLQNLQVQSQMPSSPNSSSLTANTMPSLPEEDVDREEDGLTMEFNPAISSSHDRSNNTRPFPTNPVGASSTPSIESTKTIPTPNTGGYNPSNQSQGYGQNFQGPHSGYPNPAQNEGGSTRVFNNPNGVPNGMNPNGTGPNPSNPTFGQTISMTPGSIPRTIPTPSSQEEGVKLKREYVNPERRDIRSDEERRPHTTSNSRIYLTIGAIVASLVALIVGGMLVKNYIEDTFRNSQNSSAYDELLAWAVDYPTYTEKQQKTITQWRVTFEKCTTEQKEKINDVLVSGTGKTFDELLAAAAASQSQETSMSNENVAKAEKKAKLKDDMATIQAQINNLQNQLNGINGRIMDAEANYNSKNAAYMAAQNKVQSCQNALDSLNIQLNSLPDETALQSQLSSLKAQLSTMSPTIVIGGSMDSTTSSEDDDSLTSPPVGVPGTPSGINNGNSGNTTSGSTTNSGNEEPNSNRTAGIAEDSEDSSTHHVRHYETSGTIVQNPEYQALQQEIADLENQIESISSQRFSIQVQISDAENALSEAQAAVPEMKSEVDAAYGAWQALKNEVDPIQKQIDEKNAELAQLQDEYDSIQ